MKKKPRLIAKILSYAILSCVFLSLSMIIKAIYFPNEGITHTNYFPVIQEKKEAEELIPLSINLLNDILITNNTNQMEHFHILDIQKEKNSIPLKICVVCHGNYPHTQNPRTSALYNMHIPFCSCEVCHLEFNPKVMVFYWLDNNTGNLVPDIQKRMKRAAKPGLYNAQIIPCYLEKNQEYYRLDKSIGKESAQKYLNLWMQYSFDQKSRAKIELHKGLSSTPAPCNGCHIQKNSLLDYANLGYPEQRRKDLVNSQMCNIANQYIPQPEAEQHLR